VFALGAIACCITTSASHRQTSSKPVSQAVNDTLPYFQADEAVGIESLLTKRFDKLLPLARKEVQQGQIQEHVGSGLLPQDRPQRGDHHLGSDSGVCYLAGEFKILVVNPAGLPPALEGNTVPHIQEG
jgi:hypothetical protein